MAPHGADPSGEGSRSATRLPKGLETICNASSDKLAAAMECVGENATLRDVLRSADCDADLKEAMAELMIFTTEVVGSFGARPRLRHAQDGFGLTFGAASGSSPRTWQTCAAHW